MPCMSCGGKTLTKKPQLQAAVARPAQRPIVTTKLTFGKPKINRSR